jgi:hypothetical protein
MALLMNGQVSVPQCQSEANNLMSAIRQYESKLFKTPCEKNVKSPSAKPGCSISRRQRNIVGLPAGTANWRATYTISR